MRPTSQSASIQTGNRSRRNPTGFYNCIFSSSGGYPCILKPFLKKIPTITVLSESVGNREYRVHLQAEEGSIVYLPCNTLHELQNEVSFCKFSVNLQTEISLFIRTETYHFIAQGESRDSVNQKETVWLIRGVLVWCFNYYLLVSIPTKLNCYYLLIFK